MMKGVTSEDGPWGEWDLPRPARKTRGRAAEAKPKTISTMRFVKVQFEISRQEFGFFLVWVCLVKTACQIFSGLVFCESTKRFPREKESGEQEFLSSGKPLTLSALGCFD